MIALMDHNTTGSAGPPKRTRVIFDTTERVRRAVQLRAFRLSAERAERVSVSDVLNDLVERLLGDELAVIDGNEPPATKRKR